MHKGGNSRRRTGKLNQLTPSVNWLLHGPMERQWEEFSLSLGAYGTHSLPGAARVVAQD